MLRLNEPEDLRCVRWCTVVVLVAVCALTVSVATRYCYSAGSSTYAGNTLHKRTSPEQTRQRLTKNAAKWVPPVVRVVVLQVPSSYPRIAPAGPPIPSLLFEEKLYNRPPPSSEFLS